MSSSLLDTLVTEANKSTEGLRIILPVTTAMRKAPDFKLSARVGSSILYRRRPFRTWGRE